MPVVPYQFLTVPPGLPSVPACVQIQVQVVEVVVSNDLCLDKLFTNHYSICTSLEKIQPYAL